MLLAIPLMIDLKSEDFTGTAGRISILFFVMMR